MAPDFKQLVQNKQLKEHINPSGKEFPVIKCYGMRLQTTFIYVIFLNSNPNHPSIQRLIGVLRYKYFKQASEK